MELLAELGWSQGAEGGMSNAQPLHELHLCLTIGSGSTILWMGPVVMTDQGQECDAVLGMLEGTKHQWSVTQLCTQSSGQGNTSSKVGDVVGAGDQFGWEFMGSHTVVSPGNIYRARQKSGKKNFSQGGFCFW
jgi:hypothetical protein